MLPKVSKRYYTLSFMVYLACALHTAGVSDTDIQALCRWRSADSLRAYIRWSPSEYGDLLTLAHQQEIDPLSTRNLPVMSPGPLVMALAGMAITQREEGDQEGPAQSGYVAD